MRESRRETISSADRARYRRFALDLAARGGRIGAREFHAFSKDRARQGRVEYKQDRSPVTETDRAIELYMRRRIAAQFPTHGIVGEEFAEHNREGNPCWYIDPIDGTFSFIHHIPLFTVLLALVVDGEPYLGVIHNPVLHETVIGIAGHGCEYNGRPCAVAPCTGIAQARLMTTDPADLVRRVPWGGDLFSKVDTCRTWADAYGYLLVATGRADIMIDPIMSPWDVAPLYPIISEAQGRITTLSGAHEPLGSSVLACAPSLHAELLSVVGA